MSTHINQQGPPMSGGGAAMASTAAPKIQRLEVLKTSLEDANKRIDSLVAVVRDYCNSAIGPDNTPPSAGAGAQLSQSNVPVPISSRSDEVLNLAQQLDYNIVSLCRQIDRLHAL